MKRHIAVLLVALLLPAGCATDGTSGTVGVGYYYGGYTDDWWYGSGGCCVDYPGDIGPPPHPAHPIVLPPGSAPRPENPIATPPKAEPRASPTTSSRSSMPSPRPAAGGGMRGGGGGRR